MPCGWVEGLLGPGPGVASPYGSSLGPMSPGSVAYKLHFIGGETEWGATASQSWRLLFFFRMCSIGPTQQVLSGWPWDYGCLFREPKPSQGLGEEV